MRRPHLYWELVALFLTIGWVGCGSGAGDGATQRSAPLTTTAAAADEGDEPGSDEGPGQPTLKDLGEKGRRVTVIVKPGDAAVEVDGIAVRRHDGVIELIGREGSPPRRLRVFKGLQSLEENVSITASGASPALLDLNAKPSVEPGHGGPAKAKAEHDGDEGLLTDTFGP